MLKQIWHCLTIICVVLLNSQTLAQDDKSNSSPPLSMALLLGDLGNPFFFNFAKSAEQYARREAGENIKIDAVSAGYDLSRQISQIKRFVNEGYDIILLNAVDTRGVDQVVAWAKNKGTIVVSVDVASRQANATVKSDNFNAGQKACEYIAQKLKFEGNLLILNGPPVSAFKNRVEGCEFALERYPRLQVISSDVNAGASTAGGLSSMSVLLIEHKKIDAIFAINDPTAIGADLAARQAERDDFFIVSVDGSPDGLRTMASQGSRIIATIAQNPDLMARQAVKLGIKIFSKLPLQSDLKIIPIQLVERNEIIQEEEKGR